MSVSAATSAVGGGIEGWAAYLAKQRMADAYRNEQALQQQYTQEAGNTFNRRLGQLGTGLQLQPGNRTSLYSQVNASPVGIKPLGNQATAGADANWAKMMGQNRAKLGSYGDMIFGQQMANLPTQRELNRLSSFAGSQASNVYPYEMYDAQHSWDSLAQLGALISSLGGSGMNFGNLGYGQPKGLGGPGVSSGVDGGDISVGGGGGFGGDAGSVFG